MGVTSISGRLLLVGASLIVFFPENKQLLQLYKNPRLFLYSGIAYGEDWGTLMVLKVLEQEIALKTLVQDNASYDGCPQ